MEVQLQSFLIFTVNRAKRRASRHTRETTSGAHWIGQVCLCQWWMPLVLSAAQSVFRLSYLGC